VNAIILFNSFSKVLELIRCQLGDTQNLANIIDAGFDLLGVKKKKLIGKTKKPVIRSGMRFILTLYKEFSILSPVRISPRFSTTSSMGFGAQNGRE